MGRRPGRQANNGKSRREVQIALGRSFLTNVDATHVLEGRSGHSPGRRPWADVLGRRANEGKSRRDGRQSPQHELWIGLDSVLLQEGQEFVSEIVSRMMLRLTLDVGNRPWNLRRADGKGPVPRLPFEVAAAVVMHPLRRPSLDLLDGSRNSDRRRQGQEQVDVIFHSARGQDLQAAVSSNAAHIGAQALLDNRLDRLTALLSRKHDMN